MSDQPRELTLEEKEFLGLLDENGVEKRLHPILTNAEVLAARANARRRIVAEQKKNAMKQVEDEEVRRLNREEGMRGTGDPVQNEIVNFTVDLPSWSPYMMLDMTEGVTYWHGQTYSVSRAKAASLNEIQHRQWRLDAEVEGKSKAQQYGVRHNAAISPHGRTDAPRVEFSAHG